MLTDADVVAALWSTLLKDTKLTFWKRLQSAMEWAYEDSYQSVLNDPRILEDQRPANLLDLRFYVAETALQRSATETGLVSTGQKISINGWNYTLVRGGGVSMLQSYVQTPIELARPAKFREAHSAVNTFLSAPQFDFGDLDPKIFSVALVSGIVIHGPAGRNFDLENQRLGFLNFAVPDETYRTWGLNFSVQEIIARFEQAEVGVETPQRDIARPLIKRPARKKGDTED
ncbi:MULTISPECIES: hypothetical protein [Bradyrhizobium]|uniref:hypothetical protein n=1 Tax=Bradyrhizobium pachyrhizi TaxID=280333 RepID=UPI0004811B82